DEPTNHLDMRSKDILKQALIKYDGTLIVVSHDRDFLNGIAEKIFEFRHKKIKENIGSIYDFLRKKQISSLKEIERKASTSESNTTMTSSSNKQKYLEKKEYERNLRKIKRRLEDSEKEIERLEKEIAELDRALEASDHSANGIDDIYHRYQELKERHNEEMNKWAQYTHEVEVFLQNNG
ncbi:MAG: ABC transporter ATP-binding protein, partial [Bacteroidales bacterium]|nr:ABC transporter ATP-binding protein [Bacteroidales bacterium]